MVYGSAEAYGNFKLKKECICYTENSLTLRFI